jgi:hypothetical protein
MARPAFLVSAILITAILVSAAFFLVPISRSTTTETFTSPTTLTQGITSVSTETTTTTSTEANISTSTQTITLATTSTSYALLPAACASAESAYFTSWPGAGVVVAGASSPAVVCLQLYDFNLTSPIMLNTTGVLSIQGFEHASGAKVGGGNFTIMASQDELAIGGPSDLNEGTIVAYSITANAGASGTYFLDANGWNVSLNDGNGPGVPCPIDDVVAGTGTPSYVGGLSGCGYQGYQPTTPFSIPGFNYDHLISNDLYFKVVDALNSTE